MESAAKMGRTFPDLSSQASKTSSYDSGDFRPGAGRKIERFAQAKGQTSATVEYIRAIPGVQDLTGENPMDGQTLSESQKYRGSHSDAAALFKHISEQANTTGRKDIQKILADVDNCALRMDEYDYFESGMVKYHTQLCRRHLLCRVCAIARGSKQLAGFIEKHKAAGVGTGQHCYMLTMTIKNRPDLRDAWYHLENSWRKLLQAGREKRTFAEFHRLIGGVYSFEFKRGSGSGDWHPHVHAFIVADQPLPVVESCGVWQYPALSAEWLKITGDSYIVECHPVYDAETPDDLCKAACEVFKYAVKVNGLAPEDHWQAFQILRGRRLIGTWGVYWGLEDMRPQKRKARYLQQIEADKQAPLLATAYQYIKGTGYTATEYKLLPRGGDTHSALGWQPLI
jgi:hypothetical protein